MSHAVSYRFCSVIFCSSINKPCCSYICIQWDSKQFIHVPLQAGVINSTTSSKPIGQLHGKSAISPANILHKCSEVELDPISFITQHITSTATDLCMCGSITVISIVNSAVLEQEPDYLLAVLPNTDVTTVQSLLGSHLNGQAALFFSKHIHSVGSIFIEWVTMNATDMNRKCLMVCAWLPLLQSCLCMSVPAS
jgi:hypothetical protein